MEIAANLAIERNLTNENKENELEQNIEKGVEKEEDIGEKQNKFLETTIGKVINTGLDFGLRALLPNAIENEVIGIKNTILNQGFKEGINAAISTATKIRKKYCRNIYK